ncbi:CinA family protein [uncultured Sulfitobacter sp.]|uniref:CinA family protein n=1 Tax=uncultured Sulfitobacter sp. TaxID=191468 RepID=UPI0032B2FD22|tara:strand:- start:19319 stop:19822 length:504 start_codon:yes stop_codon:yes gene_type:complete
MQRSNRHSQDQLAQRAEAVLKILCNREMKLATAESCSGGLLAALLTDIEGLSHAFERGFVTYTDLSKQELLGVDHKVLRDFGAVSRPTARAMAEGALARSGADIAVSTTGFAGPGGEGDEEGLVHFALARRGYKTVHQVESFGKIGRDFIREKCLATALSMLEETLN